MTTNEATISLSGYEVGISGAVPDRSDWTEAAQDRAILEFVSLLSGLVIKYGGRIVHGSHPTFTPVVLRQATLQAASRRAITIFRSALWRNELPSYERDQLERESEFIEVPQVGLGSSADPQTRNESLTAMRKQMVARINILVLIGGMQHKGTQLRPGVSEELELARASNIPCFLVGGFGGQAGELAGKYLASPDALGNGLSIEDNRTLLTSNDVASCAGLVFKHLSEHKGRLIPKQ